MTEQNETVAEVVEEIQLPKRGKTIADIQRVIAAGKPITVIEKFIESYRSTLDDGDFDESLTIEEELETIDFRAKRTKKLKSAFVTTTSGNDYDADNNSITKMSETIAAVEVAIKLGLMTDPDADYPLQWVLHGSKTGDGTPITYADLCEAFVLASQLRAKNWIKG